MKSNAWILFFALVMSGCGQKSENMPPPQPTPTVSSQPAASSQAVKSLDLAEAATLKGKVIFEGQVPAPREIQIKGNPECAVFHPGGKIISDELLAKDGLLQNVFVYVKEGLENQTFPVPSEPVTIDNKNCIYAPHVAGVQVDQSVILLNSDPTLHNMHSYSKNSKPWNLGLPFQGVKQTKKFTAAEVMVPLKCDVHPWMSGYLGVLPHPYFAVSGQQGEFEIKNLPPGEYVLEAWHEKLGVQSQKIKIEPRESKEIEFKFSA